LSKVRPVIQYDIDQKEIKRFGSAIEAEKETDISAENIAKVCRGKRTYAGGFIWKYADVSVYDTARVNNESSVEVDFDKGTMKSQIVTTFEAQSHEELYKLHKINPKIYKISNYWSKLRPDGRFTSSVLATIKKLGDRVDLSEFTDAVNNIVKANVVSKVKTPSTVAKSGSENNKALIFCLADEHIACSNDDSLFPNKWNESEYFIRKSRIIDKALMEKKKHGEFDKIILLNLGDNLDGFSGQTTRGGHTLPQNMSNAQAIEAYSTVNIQIWDYLIDNFPESTFEQYDMTNSNHGGLGWDAAASLVIKTYLNAKYPEVVKIHAENKLIGAFKYGITNIMYTHGKDEKYMKSPYPLNLNDTTESKIKQWMDFNEIYNKKGERNLLIKGDIHKFNWNEGKFFDYINCPSLMGATDWIMHNFGNSTPGILTLVVDKKTGDLDSSIVRFDVK